ncbi:hypothetical protein V6Z12_D08G099500 [Gossypium hirsutum]
MTAQPAHSPLVRVPPHLRAAPHTCLCTIMYLQMTKEISNKTEKRGNRGDGERIFLFIFFFFIFFVMLAIKKGHSNIVKDHAFRIEKKV